MTSAGTGAFDTGAWDGGTPSRVPLDGQSAGEPVDVVRDVVGPLLRRADLLSQLLRIGCPGDPRERDA
ncbi:hypothetical protein [Streptomyces sp. AC555_RSS877]|uniref:hypothetical protein n=1 Tax=Streptomyces sp. AC555_RSS877 TaxID=2823688 RepID=UPI001C266AF7|nr:hypothetical protein [Streptomyces sp. AC555_RSS877]